MEKAATSIAINENLMYSNILEVQVIYRQWYLVGSFPGKKATTSGLRSLNTD